MLIDCNHRKYQKLLFDDSGFRQYKNRIQSLYVTLLKEQKVCFSILVYLSFGVSSMCCVVKVDICFS